MSEYIFAGGIGCIGATIGFIIGMKYQRYLRPDARELEKALQYADENYKTMQSRLRNRLREYEQPAELIQTANQLSTVDLSSPEAINMLIQQFGGMKSLPRWLRPMIPAIASYVKENPEIVKQLVEKFTPHPKTEGEGGYDL